MKDHEKKFEYVEESTNNLKDQQKKLEAHVEKSTNNLKAHVANSDQIQADLTA